MGFGAICDLEFIPGWPTMIDALSTRAPEVLTLSSSRSLPVHS